MTQSVNDLSPLAVLLFYSWCQVVYSAAVSVFGSAACLGFPSPWMVVGYILVLYCVHCACLFLPCIIVQ